MHILNKSIFDITGILSIRPIRKLTFLKNIFDVPTRVSESQFRNHEMFSQMANAHSKIWWENLRQNKQFSTCTIFFQSSAKKGIKSKLSQSSISQ